MGGHGCIGGVDGGSSLGGQEQGVVSGIGTPELEHLIVAIVGETSSELPMWSGFHNKELYKRTHDNTH